MSRLRPLLPLLTLAALAALAAAGPAQVTEDPAPIPTPPVVQEPGPAAEATSVDPEKEAAAMAEMDVFVAQYKGAPPREEEAARAHFTAFRDGLLELERQHHGTWAGWQAMMTAGQIESRIFGEPLTGIGHYRKVWHGVRGRTDKPIKGIFLNVPRVGMRFAEALMREDLLDEAEVVLREAAHTELPERERILQRLAELPERRRLLPGQAAPAFEATDTSGKPHRLEDYRGKTLLLHYWSTINGPSLSTMPEIAKLVRETAGSDFRILSINTDQYVTREIQEALKAKGQTFLPRLFNEDDLKKALAKHQITWPVVWDGQGMEGPLVKGYTIRNLPGIYLIGPDGKIRARRKHGDRLREAVMAVLQEKG